ncbi:MAG: DUF3794 domain-containing protein [Firmicutes bacterium]|nr:DUF3794 domain-containing protein [Bacillota bacterium]
MSLSVKENRLVAVNRLGENTLQTVLQGRMDLPSTAAPIGRVVWVKGTPVLQSATIDQDRVYVQGAIDLMMVYAPETLEGEQAGLRRVEWPGALPFDHYVELIGAQPGMIPEVESTILVCEWDLRSGQYSLDVDLIVATTVRVDHIREYLAIGDVNIAKPIKLTTDGLLLNPLIPPVKLEVEKDLTAILEFPEETPSLQTVLDVHPHLQIKEREVTQGKLILRGTSTLAILFEAADYSVHEQVFSDVLPFELSFEKGKIVPDMVFQEQLQASCQAFGVNEGRAIRTELQIEGNINLQERSPARVLTEISSPGNQVQVRKEVVGVDSFVTEKDQQWVVRGLIEIGQRLPPVRELLRSGAVVHLTDYEVDEDKIVLEGVVDVELFYLAHSEEDTKPLYRGLFPEVIPFQQTLIISGLESGMQPQIKLSVQQIQPDLINRETVEVALNIRALVSVVEYLEVEVVVEAVEVEPPPEDPPTLTYVFVQNGDSVWKLARQYHTTDEAILQANPSLQNNPDLLKPGDRLCIPR